jgi:hypothetical protein
MTAYSLSPSWVGKSLLGSSDSEPTSESEREEARHHRQDALIYGIAGAVALILGAGSPLATVATKINGALYIAAQLAISKAEKADADALELAKKEQARAAREHEERNRAVAFEKELFKRGDAMERQHHRKDFSDITDHGAPASGGPRWS